MIKTQTFRHAFRSLTDYGQLEYHGLLKALLVSTPEVKDPSSAFHWMDGTHYVVVQSLR